ncbi:MAG: S9 family peptidase [Myxococcota bacterium]
MLRSISRPFFQSLACLVFLSGACSATPSSASSSPAVAVLASPPARTPAPGEKREWSPSHLTPRDVFDLEWVDNPQLSPDGRQIAYLRRSFDIMTDSVRSNLWLVNSDGSEHRPLVSGAESVSGPRFSPDGTRLLYTASSRGKSQLFVRWLDTGQTALLTNVAETPQAAEWSPDGKQIALIMNVKSTATPMVSLPEKPKGAKWAPPAKVIDQMIYRIDGRGYVDEGYSQLFVLPAEGGTPRQLTTGDYNHSSPTWNQDGTTVFVSGNRDDDWRFDLLDSEIYAVTVLSGEVQALTDRAGPDAEPRVSPDGKRIAFVGFDDRKQGYQVFHAYVMDIDGSNVRELSGKFDRDIEDLQWTKNGDALIVYYNDRGNGKIGRLSMEGTVSELASDVGGTTLGRPYPSGGFSLADTGKIAFTRTRPDHPADLALIDGRQVSTLIRLNQDILGHKALATVETMTVKAPDGRSIQSWIAKPPGFDPDQKYPLILEIHGGPFADYGDRFSTEVQLYASAGFVVLYVNPRGSTSYGEEFGNLIHHAYPGDDYDDLMASVDGVLNQGYVDPERLFVTGGSGGGVLTAWIVGKTERFKAAVVAKPVINWSSFVLYSDFASVFTQYWFPGMPWEIPEHYTKRSPLSLVGNVKTPTMLLTGEADYRTPIAESEQYYQALKLRKVDTALVRIPEASHGIAARPSHLLSKVLHIVAWFDRYDPSLQDAADADKVALGSQP